MDWDHVERRITAADWAGALTAVLAGWRRRRHPSFADLVDAVAARLPDAPVEPRRMPRGERTTFHERWLEQARTANAASLGPLMATLTRAVPREGRIAVWTERLEALGPASDDPRVAATLVQLLRRAHWAGEPGGRDIVPIYAPVMEMLARIGDERLLDAMRELDDDATTAPRAFRQYLAGALPPVIEAIASASAARPAIEVEEQARAAAVLDTLCQPAAARAGKGTGGRDESALLELVVASPHDDGPREVLADYWLEQGDPRGELVTHGLRAARSSDAHADDAWARCDALVRSHEKTWLGTVARVTSDRVYARGFLTEIVLENDRAAEGFVWISATREPCLATVQVVHRGPANEAQYRRFVMSPGLRSLGALTVVSEGMLEEVLGRRDAWPVEHLVLGFRANATLLDRVARSNVLPRMTRLSLGVGAGTVDDGIALAAAFLQGRPLQSIGAVPLFGVPMPPLAAWLQASRGALRTAGTVEISDPSDARRTRLLARPGRAGGMDIDIVATHLTFARQVIPQLQGIEHVRLRWPEHLPPHGPANADLPNELAKTHKLPNVELDDRWKAFLARPR